MLPRRPRVATGAPAAGGDPAEHRDEGRLGQGVRTGDIGGDDGAGRIVRVDFLAEGRSTKSAILTLSSGNASQAHVAANEIFRRWYDLDTPTRNEQRVTILDDRADVYREDDIQRLRDLSQIVAFSDRQTLSDLLAA